MHQIVIIGNGIAGITCARHLRKKTNHPITVISAESEHFFSRTALMYIYMGHMKYEHTKPYEDFFWLKNNITLLQKKVTGIDSVSKKVIIEEGLEITYDKLVIATGSVTAMYDWPGQQLKGVSGLYSLQDLQKIETYTKDIKQAVIVGGGLIGTELAEMLHTRNIDVTILVKDKHYWGSVLPPQDSKLVEKQMQKNGITIMPNTEMKEIKGDINGNATAVITKDGKEIKCAFVGITAGVRPNISFLKESDIKTDKGILINEYFETNKEGIYAIGDCAEFEKPLPGRKSIEQVWYTGRMHGETLAQTLAGTRTAYRPGPWFNSAKFFDLEYQTYGIVPARKEEGNEYFFWQHPIKDTAMGIYYRKSDKVLLAINSYGIRLRHVLFDAYLKQNKSVDFVLSYLNSAVFDPEFSKNYVQDIINAWNKETGNSVKKKNRLAAAFHF